MGRTFRKNLEDTKPRSTKFSKRIKKSFTKSISRAKDREDIYELATEGKIDLRYISSIKNSK